MVKKRRTEEVVEELKPSVFNKAREIFRRGGSAEEGEDVFQKSHTHSSAD